ncbi:hypothetical protein Syun_006567 [Stephania yunnanensis]|uniref:BHLH domain-containing protein n=1 Tax=Stephania yunnanensis TaxID=152371 RepID=A0AAP0Q1H1_9MAGN
MESTNKELVVDNYDDAFLFEEELNKQTTSSPTLSLKVSAKADTTATVDDIDNNIASSWGEQISEDFQRDLQMMEGNQHELFINFFSSTSNVETGRHHQLNHSSSSSSIVESESPLFLDICDFHHDGLPILESSDSYNNPSVVLTLKNSLNSTELEACDNDMLFSPEDCDKFFNVDNVDQDEQTVLKDHFINSTITTTSSSVDDPASNKPRGQVEDGDDIYELEETVLDDHLKKIGGANLNCKNLVSERNRRKRLSQQLLALRALVPNITKMDKRSVLVDALNYLRSIQEETGRLVKELKQREFKQPKLSINQRDRHPSLRIESCRIPSVLAYASSRSRAQITKIETEKIEDRRFVVKMTYKGGVGVGGDVLHVFESLGFEITYSTMQQLKPHETNTEMFIRVYFFIIIIYII